MARHKVIKAWVTQAAEVANGYSPKAIIMDADWSVELYRFSNGRTPFEGFVLALSRDAGRRVVILDGRIKKRWDIPVGVLRLMRGYKADLESRDESKKI